MISIIWFYHVPPFQAPSDEPTHTHKCHDEHNTTIEKSFESVEVIPILEITLWVWRFYAYGAFPSAGYIMILLVKHFVD